MKAALLTGILAALSLHSFAGDWGKAPVVDKTPIEECLDVGGVIAAGYETDYIFRGIRFARDSVWTDLNYTFDNFAVPLTIGAWYQNGINGAFNGPINDELRLSARAQVGTFAGVDASLGYTHYTFPEFRSAIAPVGGYGELNLSLVKDLGPIALAYDAYYAMGGGGISPNGWFHQLGAFKGIPVTDNIDLVLGAGVGYSSGFWGPSGWNHYYLNASLPIELNCRATLTPYIGYNGAPDTWIADGARGTNQPQSDILHGGVSLSVSF